MTRRFPVELLIGDDAPWCAHTAATIIERCVQHTPTAVLGVATGSTPRQTYANLGRDHTDLSAVTVVMLDEYVGLAPTDAHSYRAEVRSTFGRLGVDSTRILAPDGMSADPHAAAAAYDAMLAPGVVALQILGLGRNGHIGFNEPGSAFDSRTRVVALSDTTRADNARFFEHPADVPRRAISQGIGTILGARRLLLIVTGEHKAQALASALDQPPTTDVPASAVQLHPAATVVADRAAAHLLKDAPSPG